MDKPALVVTTIKVPVALERYRAQALCGQIYVVGDIGAPDDMIARFCDGIGARYYSAADQRQLGYACSDLLGWRDPARRSIGCLEAVKDGAEIIVVADDDNLPIDRHYFTGHWDALTMAFSGLVLEDSVNGFADPWSLIQPRVRHRGFPQELWHVSGPPVIGWTTGARIGVNAGVVLGDPDIDATERITSAPCVYTASPVLDAGVALHRAAYAPFNQQNIAFRRELLPVMAMLTPAGRPADIWCAYVAERVMRETGWSVRYGRPYVWQQRNEHNLANDVAAEVRGYKETIAFVDQLDMARLPGNSTVLECARYLFSHLHGGLDHGPFSDIGHLGLAWVKDCEQVMA